MPTSSCSRRQFLAVTAAAPFVTSLPAWASATKKIPIGLELFSVRGELKKDEKGTLREVAKLGYQCVEFYAPYYSWTPEYAKEIRQELDSLGVKCYSTHNGFNALDPAGIDKAIELNKALGTRYVVLAHPGNVSTVDDWMKVAARLNVANVTLSKEGLHAGYHNHDLEWKPVGGKKPIEILAEHTDPSIMLQLDVGTCVETGNDPVAWINKNPGRIRSLHLKEWSPEVGYKALFGEGKAPWKEIFAAAETTGGVEYYLIEQEGSRYPEIETAEKCLQAYKAMHG
jgi:sugar phosphate isomerase/epimerase